MVVRLQRPCWAVGCAFAGRGSDVLTRARPVPINSVLIQTFEMSWFRLFAVKGKILDSKL